MLDPEPEKILFVCSLNRFRSYTAEKLFEGFDRYAVRSRGTERNARIKLTAGDLGWADVVFTMEKRHSERIRQQFPEAAQGKPIILLGIKDLYPAMDPRLMDLLRAKLHPYLELPD
jgi:predicted protein tyrosine phosphatase